MNKRVQKLRERLRVDQFHICVEKAGLVVESLRQTEGEPEILRRAKATANFLDNRTVFIEEDELVVGNVASKPMGMEAGTMGPTWPEDTGEEVQKAAAAKFVDKFCNPEKPAMLSLYARNLATPIFRKALYRLSRIRFSR
jgi:pyruvate-formate lyase